MLNVRCYSWSQGGLSWAPVVANICKAFENLGHNTYILSTNGLKDSDQFLTEDRMVKSALALQNFGPGKNQIDIDFTYTVPINFQKRFLLNSKNKCAIYNYETNFWPIEWQQYYHLADYFFPSSNFSAEIFHINGVPTNKIFVVPHGVDTSIFNSSVPKIKLKTQKKFKFCSVVAPHYRKNIPALLNAYCSAFNNKDDVCLVLKTKIFKHSDGMHDANKNPNGRKPFEIVLGDVFSELKAKFGSNIPEIEIITGHVENVSSIYNACQCHVSTTGAEGFGLIFLESMACGLFNIAPAYSGQLDFLNDRNSLLIDTSLRYAKRGEQYWIFNPKSKIGEVSIKHTAQLMRKAFSEYDELKNKFDPEIKAIVKKLSWNYVAQNIIDVIDKKVEHYLPGTYKL